MIWPYIYYTCPKIRDFPDRTVRLGLNLEWKNIRVGSARRAYTHHRTNTHVGETWHSLSPSLLRRAKSISSRSPPRKRDTRERASERHSSGVHDDGISIFFFYFLPLYSFVLFSRARRPRNQVSSSSHCIRESRARARELNRITREARVYICVRIGDTEFREMRARATYCARGFFPIYIPTHFCFTRFFVLYATVVCICVYRAATCAAFGRGNFLKGLIF